MMMAHEAESTLIIATSESTAGHLKSLDSIVDILTITDRLLTGSTSIANTIYHLAGWTDPGVIRKRLHRSLGWSEIPALCQGYHRIELWIDPDPNAQLLLVRLLDWLKEFPEIAPRLWLNQANTALGEQRPGDWVRPSRRIQPADLTLATKAWSAWQAPTPEAWLSLRNDSEPFSLPSLRGVIDQMLQELPDATGLGTTMRRILGSIEQERNDLLRSPCEEDGGYLSIMRRLMGSDRPCPFSYFEIGEALCDLAAAPHPAILGVTERHFDLDMHEDAQRLRRFQTSRLSLTPLGRAIVTGKGDWSRHNPIHRWWGGTLLTNDTLWRWDPHNGRLSAPNKAI